MAILEVLTKEEDRETDLIIKNNQDKPAEEINKLLEIECARRLRVKFIKLVEKTYPSNKRQLS